MNMKQYKIELAKGHILFTDDNGARLLVDTGSPLSFSSKGNISLCGDTVIVPTSILNVDDDYISEKVELKTDGLVGMDIIGKHGLLIDVPGGSLIFGYSSEGMVRIPSSITMGYVCMAMKLRDYNANVILDTGAPISYVSPSVTEGLVPYGSVTDFNPFVPGDTFRTELYEFPSEFAGESLSVSAGHLPPMIQTMISLLGADGVFGMAILGRRKVLISDGGVWVEKDR